EPRRDPVGADPRAICRREVRVAGPRSRGLTRKSGALGRRERRAVEELRAPLGRSADRLAPPPARDRRVIAREEDRGDATTLVLDRPRVLRTLEESPGVGLVLERLALDDARATPGHRVDHDHRTEPSDGVPEVPDREPRVNV